MMASFTPSNYQRAVFDALLYGSGNLQMEAVAGSGKTTTLCEAARRLPYAVRSRTLMLAFNRHIKKEMEDRQRRGDLPQEIKIQTIHGLGYGVLSRHLRSGGKAGTDGWVLDRKYDLLTRIYFDDLTLAYDETRSDAYKEAIRITTELTRFAMVNLTDPEDDKAMESLSDHYEIEIPPGYEEIVLKGPRTILKWGREGLALPDRDNRTYHPSETIGYDDMLWLPNVLDLGVPRYDLIMVDEAQDLSKAQLELVLRAKAADGRAIFVGDGHQAIYGFTGADSESFQNIRRRTGALVLPLSICYRCARSIVSKASAFVPQIEPSPHAPEGVVIQITEPALVALAASHYRNPQTRSDPFMLLCRVNAPLVSLAFELIADGIPAQVKGRDIGASILRTVDSIAALDGFHFDEFLEWAESYRLKQAAVLAKKTGSEMRVASLWDRVQSAIAIYEGTIRNGRRGLSEMRATIDELFTNTDQIVSLSTVHKAKGLEARKVGILRPDLMPHPKAKAPWEREQERNLCYVALTRAREELYLAGPLGFDMDPRREERSPYADGITLSVPSLGGTGTVLEEEITEEEFETLLSQLKPS